MESNLYVVILNSIHTVFTQKKDVFVVMLSVSMSINEVSPCHALPITMETAIPTKEHWHWESLRSPQGS